MLKEVENLADKCKCNKCVDQHKEEKNQKEKPKTKSIKDELIELINNGDDNLLCQQFDTGNIGQSTWTRFDIIKDHLRKCQKNKELTLEEKLLADGYIENVLGAVPIGVYRGDLVVDYTKNDLTLRISDQRNIYFFCGASPLSSVKLSVNYTQNYEIIKKAVELVRSM